MPTSYGDLFDINSLFILFYFIYFIFFWGGGGGGYSFTLFGQFIVNNAHYFLSGKTEHSNTLVEHTVPYEQQLFLHSII